MSKTTNFIKENFSILKKFLINQITMSIFGLFLTIPMMFLSENKSLGDIPIIISSIVAFLVFMFIIHDLFWQLGAKDGIKLRSRNIIPEKTLGLKLVLVAYSPTILLVIITNIMYLLSINFSQEWAGNIYGVVLVIVNFIFHGMYFGIYNLYFVTQPYFMFIFVVITVLLPSLSYILGIKEKKFRAFFGLGNVDFNTKKK